MQRKTLVRPARHTQDDGRRTTDDEDTDVRHETRVQGVLGTRGAAHVRHGVEQVRDTSATTTGTTTTSSFIIIIDGRRRLRALSRCTQLVVVFISFTDDERDAMTR